MGTVQKFIVGTLALSALALAVSHPQGVYKTFTGAQRLIGGTETQIIKSAG